MKSLITLSLLAPALVFAVDPPKKPELTKDSVPGLKIIPPPLFPELFDANGKLQSVLSNPPGVPLPKATVPDIQQLEPSDLFKGSKKTKIRYGPFRLPGTKEKNWQVAAMGLTGMADEYLHNITKPCKECVLLALSANLEYANGTKTGSSAWLHHSAVVSSGPKVRDPICNASNTEVFFSAGNERSLVVFTPTDPTDPKAGYRVRSEDMLSMVGEYKNELETPQWVWLTLTWDYYDGPRPDFRNSHVVWLSAGGLSGCDPNAVNPFGASNLTSKGVPKKLVFSESSMPWTSPVKATILGVGGHLHDGGVGIDFYQNGKRICESATKYDVGAAAAGSMGNHAGGEHISNITSCHLMSPININDKFWITAKYDLIKHKGSQMENGTLDEVMAVGTMLIIN